MGKWTGNPGASASSARRAVRRAGSGRRSHTLARGPDAAASAVATQELQGCRDEGPRTSSTRWTRRCSTRGMVPSPRRRRPEGRPSEDRCLRLVGIDRPCRAEARREGAGKGAKRKETERNELVRSSNEVRPSRSVDGCRVVVL